MVRGWLVAGLVGLVMGMPLAGADAPLGLGGSAPDLGAATQLLSPVAESLGGVVDLLAPDAPDAVPEAQAGASPDAGALLAPLAPLLEPLLGDAPPLDPGPLVPAADPAAPDVGEGLALPPLDVGGIVADLAPALPPATLPEMPRETGLGGGATAQPQLPARPAVPGLPGGAAPRGSGPNLGSQTIGADLGPRQGLGEQLQAWMAGTFGDAFAALPPEARAFLGNVLLVLATGLASVLALVTGFRHLQKDNLLEHTFRHQVLDLIRANPGLHLREVARRLGLTATNASYHLRVLEKHGFIRSERMNGKRVYVPSAGPADKARFLAQSLLHRDSRARVVHALAAHPGSNQTALAALTAQHQGAVSWHLRQLVHAGLVLEQRTPRECRYQLTALGRELAAGRVALPASVATTAPAGATAATMAPAGTAPAALAFK